MEFDGNSNRLVDQANWGRMSRCKQEVPRGREIVYVVCVCVNIIYMCRERENEKRESICRVCVCVYV